MEESPILVFLLFRLYRQIRILTRFRWTSLSTVVSSRSCWSMFTVCPIKITLKVYSFSAGLWPGCLRNSVSDKTPAPNGRLATGPRLSPVPLPLLPAPDHRPTRITHATSHSSRVRSVVERSWKKYDKHYWLVVNNSFILHWKECKAVTARWRW